MVPFKAIEFVSYPEKYRSPAEIFDPFAEFINQNVMPAHCCYAIIPLADI